MVRYDPYTDSFIDNTTKEITATINLDAIPKDIIRINEVVAVSDESIEKIADAVVRKLADRKEENSSEKPNNCEDKPQTSGVVWTEDAIKDEPKSYSIWASTDEPQRGEPSNRIVEERATPIRDFMVNGKPKDEPRTERPWGMYIVDHPMYE